MRTPIEDLSARDLPRRVFEWFFRVSELRAARAALHAVRDDRDRAGRQATLLVALARRVAAPGAPLPPGARPAAVELSLYREAVTWALAALRPDTEAGDRSAELRAADLRALWEASGPSSDSDNDDQELAALRRILIDDFSPYSLAVSDGDVARVRPFAAALAERADLPRRRIARALVQRWRRLAVAGTIALGLAIGGRVLAVGPDLAAGRPFRLSSSWSEWRPCLVTNHCFGLMLHTEAQDNPWVEFDLGAPRKVRRIEVFNRENCCAERATPLVAEVSTDRATWAEVARSDRDFGSWTPTFPATIARYVRLRVPRRSILHLAAIAIR